MQWEEFKNIERDPEDRLWEYDGDGTPIYKVECGFGLKTLWDGGYVYWKKKYGSDWYDK
tara:strand:+ start:23 stop:199 length:177 start_codon:yes stop_codon:yes gene_type:complete